MDSASSEIFLGSNRSLDFHLGDSGIYLATDIGECYIDLQSSRFILMWILDQDRVFTRIVVVSIPVVPWGLDPFGEPPSYPYPVRGQE